MWKDIKTNKEGHLLLGNVDSVDLAKQYGTPLIVMEEDVIRASCRDYMRVFNSNFKKGKVAYAGKAFSTTAMLKIVESEGLCLDVVSEGELMTAKNAGFPMEKIYHHGNSKTNHELKTAVKLGVGTIIIDGEQEIDVIDNFAKEMGKVQNVGVRVKPGIDAHTHKYIITGNEDSKFGFGINDGMAEAMIKDVLNHKNLKLTTLHCHIGSQIFEMDSFLHTVDIMTDFIKQMSDKLGMKINEINFGGGFGIHYIDNDKPLAFEKFVEAIAEKLEECIKTKGLYELGFVIEPGRSIVGEAGTTLYTVTSIKDIKGIRKYVSVDGGMTDNPRLALYQAEYLCSVANKQVEEQNDIASIAGRCCESGDMLIWDAKVQKCEIGDILAVFSTGAYNYSMASNYNKVPHPAVVLVKDGKSALMVKRQSFEQLMQNDTVPEWL